MEYHVLMLLVWFLLNLCAGLQPADKGANAKTKATLEFIDGLPKQGIIIEQYSLILIHGIK